MRGVDPRRVRVRTRGGRAASERETPEAVGGNRRQRKIRRGRRLSTLARAPRNPSSSSFRLRRLRLAHGVDVFARRERLLRESLAQERGNLRSQRVPRVPVGGVVVKREGLLAKVRALDDEELVVRVVHHALVHPPLHSLGVRRGRRAEQPQQQVTRGGVARPRRRFSVNLIQERRASEVRRAPRHPREQRHRPNRRLHVEPRALQR